MITNELGKVKNEKLGPLKEKYILLTNQLHEKKGDETKIRNEIAKVI